MIRTSALVIAAGAVALASLACTINIPSTQFSPKIELGPTGSSAIGPEQTQDFNIPATGSAAGLHIAFAAGKLQLSGGGEELLTGTATYNVSDLKPVVEGSGASFRVRSGEVEGFPATAMIDLVNTWELTLGPDPVDLTLELGAAKAEIDLGDVPVTQLTVKTGATDLELDFSSPNSVSMDSFTVAAGAARLDLRGLANANTNHMEISLGGGDLNLDFSGDLTEGLDVTIDGAAGNFTINVPQGTAASLITNGALISVHPETGWTSGGDGYIHEGRGPKIGIRLTAGAGNVNLRTR
ncbi:MAG TPA: toast rack family protein [Anaerolineales bacterium]|nr:toast rack family protein [Anaerolineales bacterium]